MGRLTIPKEIRRSLNLEGTGSSDPFKTIYSAFNVNKPFRELRRQAEISEALES